MVLSVSIWLFGCSEGKENHLNQGNSSKETLNDGSNEATNKNGEIVDTHITNEAYLKAIKLLKPDIEFSDSLINEIRLQQLKINQGLYIVWTEHSIPNTELPMLVVFDVDKKPIYVKTFRERIESVKYIGEYVFDKGIIEVTSYGASGSFSGQWVNLLLLNNDSVKDIWEYQTISNDSRLSDEEGITEYFHSYGTYLMMPTYQQQFSDQETTQIIVNNSSEEILVDKDKKVVSRNQDTNQLSYIWDEEKYKFVKEE